MVALLRMNNQGRRDEWEAWWALFARIIAFFLGATILGYETVTGGNRLYIIVTGAGLCGPVIAQSIATIFGAIRGGGPR
jgi:hypothetical protein